MKEQLVFTGEDSPLANLMVPVSAGFGRALIGERRREGIGSGFTNSVTDGLGVATERVQCSGPDAVGKTG